MNSIPETPYGLCRCGCGQPAPLFPYNDKQRGYVKGEPARFIKGHQNRGRRFSTTRVECVCPVCDTHFTVKPSDIKHGRGVNCSRACSDIARQARLEMSCQSCGKIFPMRLSKVALGYGKFCSRACYDAVNCPPTEQRFWSYVNKTDTCWLWTGGLNSGGYGHFSIGRHGYTASRYAYELEHGAIPDGLLVLHHCDVPACVRHDHLFLGDDKANVHDMMNKGRDGFTGERNYSAKLTEAKVREIRRLASEGMQKRAIARIYGVTDTLICLIILGKAWKHVT